MCAHGSRQHLSFVLRIRGRKDGVGTINNETASTAQKLIRVNFPLLFYYYYL